ncbi:hypothetical protein GJAV_G00096860 [Gymnothorax javanicus]|nr:hypothetical protein GJAV_G00096860 [Gymnothorax javanicus]
MGTTVSHSRENMYGYQKDRPKNPGGRPSSVSLVGKNQPRGQSKCKKDGNFNFLGQEDDVLTGDENRNPLRSRVQGSLGSGMLSPLSRLPCWSPLEPLPEIEIGEEGCGRVPPEGAEGEMEEEMERGRDREEEKKVLRAAEVAGAGRFGCVWDRICVGGPRAEELTANGGPGDGEGEVERGCKGVGGAGPPAEGSSDSDADLCSELQGAVWTLQDREDFKAREMEKHQVQLTMYRRLALIRWVRTLQGRVQEQQNRLQASFDIILTHRKELLRLGAATATKS